MPFNRNDFNLEASPQTKSPKENTGMNPHDRANKFRNSPKSSDFFDNYAFESVKRNEP